MESVRTLSGGHVISPVRLHLSLDIGQFVGIDDFVMTPPLKRRGLLRTCTDGVSSHTVEAFPFSQRGGLRCSVQANGTLGIR